MRPFRSTLSLLLICALAGCGSSSAPPEPTTPPPAPEEPTGMAIIGLTDAPGDFLSYQVDVTGLRFERANGAIFDVLPETTTLDFATYVEVTELVTIATLPSGVYNAVTLTLDYSNANIVVEDLTGVAAAATIVDDNGQPLTRAELSVSFPDSDRFVIAPGVPSHVTLDFDLEASHKVELQGTPTATLDSVLLADTLLDFPKPRRARGLLLDVDAPNSSVQLQVRPFFHPRGNFGEVSLITDSATEYEIDQMPYVGEQGLVALDALPEGSALVVTAQYDKTANQLVAERILAGTSVPWADADIASGSVAARNGDVLTLRGATYVRKDMSVTYNQNIEVVLDAQTRIRQIGGDLQPLTAADISVGQRLTVLGDHNQDGSLNATDGLVRIDYATVSGEVAAVSPLRLELSRYNGRRPEIFDFLGTGADVATDADPSNYEVDTGSIDLASLNIGDPVRIRGHVTPFGSAPQDFVARTIASVTEVAGRIRIRWQAPGVADAVLAADGQSLIIDLQSDALTPIHYLTQSGVRRDLLDLGSTVSLAATQSGAGVYALRIDSQMTMYFDFASFSAALTEALDGSRGLVALRGDVIPDSADAYVTRRLTAVVLSTT